MSRTLLNFASGGSGANATCSTWWAPLDALAPPDEVVAEVA